MISRTGCIVNYISYCIIRGNCIKDASLIYSNEIFICIYKRRKNYIVNKINVMELYKHIE